MARLPAKWHVYLQRAILKIRSWHLVGIRFFVPVEVQPSSRITNGNISSSSTLDGDKHLFCRLIQPLFLLAIVIRQGQAAFQKMDNHTSLFILHLIHRLIIVQISCPLFLFSCSSTDYLGCFCSGVILHREVAHMRCSLPPITAYTCQSKSGGLRSRAL